MSQKIRNIQPKELWNKFADLNAIPRPSKKETLVIAFMKNFGETLNLETHIDPIGNVIIKKPATKGMEDRKTIVLQAHLDMVHQKNADTVFDFEKQGIEMYIDGDWVKAKGTTLGADNGIGIATIMAILESQYICHPAIEALFTIDEETGMTGAMELQTDVLKGEILLNLDTEEDDEIDIGCAGGIDITASKIYQEEITPENTLGYSITVKGLLGGHSGLDIDKGLGNANKIMNRLLFDTYHRFGIQIAEIDGGGLRNAIPRESYAYIVIPHTSESAWKQELEKQIENIKTEFKTKEPNLTITIQKTTKTPHQVMAPAEQEKLTRALYAAHDGIYRMNPDMSHLVETSNNIAQVIVKNGTITIHCLTRSSVESSKYDLANALRATFELIQCKVIYSNNYSGWTPNLASPILKIVETLYEKQYTGKPRIIACHAGLECGILGIKYPEMDMISFGPTIRGAHSPDEKVCISSVEKYWNFIIEILQNIPKKIS